MGLLITGVAIYLFAWWGDQSNSILLKYYGFNMHGMNETELYEKVLPENIERVKKLEISRIGIGWPLKTIFGFIIFIPYLLAIFLGSKIIERIKK